MEQYTNFILTSDKNTIDGWLSQLDAAYAAGTAGLSDEMYDQLVRLYESRFGKRFVIGSKPTHGAVQLPIAMMSLDKIMKEKELNSFISKNPPPYMVMDKINGNAGLYAIMNGKSSLYNRGDGTEGADLSHVLPYLKLPVLPFNIYIKGELVINKSDYEPFKNEYKTNLAMINGILNSQSPDPAKLALFKFVAYDMAFPDNQNIELTMTQTLTHLVKYGFVIPYNMATPGLTINWLSELFKYRKETAPYDVDGLVIVADRPVKYAERLIRENPKYAIAFKEYGDTAVAIVEQVIWEASKHRIIKPVVKITPVTINSFTIKSLTAFNAKYIVDNKIGPGTKLLITHNTIPYIMDVLEGTYPQMPDYPEGSWQWNDTGVDIVLLQANDEVKIAQIYEFFKQIGAKYWGETTLAKFYQAGFDTIKKMVESTKEDFMKRDIEGIGEGIIDRMVKTRDETLPTVTLSQLMSASGAFGMGFGTRKITAILDVYPDVLNQNITVEQIVNINGFAQKTAERFVEGLPKFKQFIEDIPILQRVINGELKPVVQKIEVRKPMVSIAQAAVQQNISGKSIVFTGFRDKQLEDAVKAQGGSVKTSVSKKTDYVVVGGPKGQGSSKENKAIEYGIPILNLAEFKSMFGFN